MGLDIETSDEGITMSFGTMGLGLGLGLGVASAGVPVTPGDDPRSIPDYTGQTAIPGGLLVNTQITTLGDSRGAITQAKRIWLNQDATYALVSTASAVGGVKIDAVNGIGGTDQVLTWLESDIGVGMLIAGINGADATGATNNLANLQASMTALLKRINSLRVSAGSFTGTWARATSGDLDKIGMAATHPGGTCTVSAVNGTHVWLRDIVGPLSNGDTITATGWSAVLTEAVPAKNDRALLVTSETPIGVVEPPAGATGREDFKLYAEWLDTLADAAAREALFGAEATPIRMVHYREAIWGAAWSDDYPMPFDAALTDDALHPNVVGWYTAAEAARSQITALLSNYPNQHPGVRSDPPVGTDIPTGAASLMGTLVPLTGGDSDAATKVPPTGWNIDVNEAKGASFEVFGPATDQGIALTYFDTVADGTGPGSRYVTGQVSASAPGIPVGERVRAGVRFRLTNTAGTGPATNVRYCNIDFEAGNKKTTGGVIVGFAGHQWYQSIDVPYTVEATGALRIRLLIVRDSTSLPVDYRLEFDKIGFYHVSSYP